jgi:hypothetical protein
MWGIIGANGMRRLLDLLDTIVLLKNHNLHGTGVIGVYHARRVASLMVHALPLYEMMPDGIVLA